MQYSVTLYHGQLKSKPILPPLKFSLWTVPKNGYHDLVMQCNLSSKRFLTTYGSPLFIGLRLSIKWKHPILVDQSIFGQEYD